MLISSHFRRATTLVALAMMLTSCASSPGSLAVKLTDQCLRLGGIVPPPSITAASDYRELASDTLARLNRANRGSAARTRCEQQVINEYAAAK